MIVTFFNQKGGAGKTSASVLAACHFHEQGVRVAVVDTDRQRSADKWQKRSTPEVAALPFCVHPLADTTEAQMARALKPIQATADLVIVDTRPDIESADLFNALVLSDRAIIPMVPEPFVFEAFEEIRPLLARVNVRRAQLDMDKLPVAVLINQVDERQMVHRQYLELIRAQEDFHVLAPMIPRRTQITQAQMLKTTLSAVAPRSSAVRREFARVANAILEFCQ